VAELVYAYVSEAYGFGLEGSSPSIRTKKQGLIPRLEEYETIFSKNILIPPVETELYFFLFLFIYYCKFFACTLVYELTF
jgi:hypothetical protein